MLRRVKWMLIKPFDKIIFDQIVSAITLDQFTSNATSGFLIDTRRSEYIESRFIQKFETKEIILDPFGNESEIIRVSYTQLGFRLQKKAPQLELYDCPRNLNSFVNRLGEFTKGSVAVYPPEIAVESWLEILAKRANLMTVTGALISDLEFENNIFANIALSGESDVRKEIKNIVGKRKYLLSQAAVKIRFEDEEGRLTIRPECRAAYDLKCKSFEILLRDCLQQVLQKTVS